jgi:hypothetical protein
MIQLLLERFSTLAILCLDLSLCNYQHDMNKWGGKNLQIPYELENVKHLLAGLKNSDNFALT